MRLLQAERRSVPKREHPLSKRLRWLMLTFVLLPSVASAAEPGVERIPWRKLPIRLPLAVGEERLVHFPAAVRVGVPESLHASLRVQAIDGTLYLLAQRAFDARRILVREVAGSQVYLLDVEASTETQNTHPVRIVREEENDTESAGVGRRTEAAAEPILPRYSYVTLTRFAAQQLYAPARMLRVLPGVVRTLIRSEPIPLVRGGGVAATPLVAWRAPGLYLTAVRLVNRDAEPRELDPWELRGQWLTAAFQHNRLLPAGDEADTTAVY